MDKSIRLLSKSEITPLAYLHVKGFMCVNEKQSQLFIMWDTQLHQEYRDPSESSVDMSQSLYEQASNYHDAQSNNITYVAIHKHTSIPFVSI